jgi:sugar phosphate isomerase/epimerase
MRFTGAQIIAHSLVKAGVPYALGIPGKGHAESFWREFVAALQRAGYAGSLSIEYAGPRAEAPAGIVEAAALLRRARACGVTTE